MRYKDGNLVECDTFYNDKGELEYQKKSLEKAVALDAIATRRKGKKEHEYEVKWSGMSIDFLTWVGRGLLVEMGYKTQVQREDEKQAAMAGLQNKQLTTPGVEKHLADFGVPAEFATHNNLRSLSAGQKVKVVLGAAMWQNPHNLAFCDQVATEKWIMDAGHLRAEGGEYVDVKLEAKVGDDTITDASGNVIDVQRSKKMDPKDIKKAIKDAEKKLKDHKKKQSLTDEEAWALEDKLQELKDHKKKQS